MNIISPVTGGSVKVIRSLSVHYVQWLYENGLGVTVESYFRGLDVIRVCECLDTSYRFFAPFNLCGNDALYTQLELHDWYYQESRWEYKAAMMLITSGDDVLEVGSGRGYFLQQCLEKGSRAMGLELNGEAIRYAAKRGIATLDTPMSDFAAKGGKVFDIVCAFQLLEHLADVKSFFENAVLLLKRGGKLILSVPNNDAFFFRNRAILPRTNSRHINHLQTLALNLPPHHMGLWNRDAFERLPQYFGIKLVDIFQEPPNEGRIQLNNEILLESSWSPVDRFLRRMANKKSFLAGDSLLVVYEKR